VAGRRARGASDRAVLAQSAARCRGAEVSVEPFDELPQCSPAHTGELGNTEDTHVSDNDQPNRRVQTGRTTRIQDPQLRSAIETHAVDAAIDHYTELGATEIVKLGKPYDIRLFSQMKSGTLK